MLKNYGQKTGGRKADLIERLEKVRRKEAAGIPVSDQAVHQDTELRWYMLQTANGFEGTVERTLRNAINVQKLHSEIAEIYLPMAANDTSVRDSSRMPAYLFIRMKMSQSLHSFVTSMSYVIQFVGADNGLRNRAGQMAGGRGFVWPRPISDAEYHAVKKLSELPQQRSKEVAFGEGFLVDDFVEVTKGPFRGLAGPVVSVAAETNGEDGAPAGDDGGVLTVELLVMGTVTPVTVPARHCVESSPDKVEAQAAAAAAAASAPEKGLGAGAGPVASVEDKRPADDEGSLDDLDDLFGVPMDARGEEESHAAGASVPGHGDADGAEVDDLEADFAAIFGALDEFGEGGPELALAPDSPTGNDEAPEAFADPVSMIGDDA